MKPGILALALLLLPHPAAAENLDLGPHGTFSIAVPKGWTFSATKVEDTGYAIILTPPADVNARCLFNILYVPGGEPYSKEDVQEKVLAISDQFMAESVEKKKVLRDFAVSMGYGAYCVFTDASRVGQPPEKDSFKVVAVGMIRFNDDLSAAVSMGTDDEKGPDFAAMMKAVSSATVSPRK
jgi:hypothetical protein